MKRYEVPKRKTTHVYFKELLASPQIDKIKKNTKNQIIERVTLSVEAYFDSNSGIVKKENDLYALDVKAEL